MTTIDPTRPVTAAPTTPRSIPTTPRSIPTTPRSIPTTPRSDRAPFAVTDWLLFAAVGLVWGSSFLLMKIGLESFHPGFIAWARTGLGALALAIVAARPGRRPIAPQDRGRVVALSVLWVALPFTLLPVAEQHLTSAATGLLMGATPLFTGLIAARFFDRVPRGAQRYGMAIGFAGVVLVSVGSGRAATGSTVAVVLVLTATASYGVATNLAVSLQQRYGSVVLMGRMLAYATLWTAPFGVAGLARSSVALGPTLAITVLGVVGTGFGFVLMSTLVGRVGGPRGSMITYLIPLVALGLGAVVLGERVAPLAVGGAGLVLVGALLAARQER